MGGGTSSYPGEFVELDFPPFKLAQVNDLLTTSQRTKQHQLETLNYSLRLNFARGEAEMFLFARLEQVFRGGNA